MRATRLSVANYNTTLSSDSLETGTGKFEFTSLAVHRAESREIRACARDLRGPRKQWQILLPRSPLTGNRTQRRPRGSS